MNETPEIAAVQQLGRTYRSVMGAFETGIGYSMPRWRILISLHQSGPTSQKQLTYLLRVDPAALTRQVKAMECEGLVARHMDPDDNRLTIVALTDAGRQRVEETLPLRTAFFEQAFSGLSADQTQMLTDLLHALELRMREPLP